MSELQGQTGTRTRTRPAVPLCTSDPVGFGGSSAERSSRCFWAGSPAASRKEVHCSGSAFRVGSRTRIETRTSEDVPGGSLSVPLTQQRFCYQNRTLPSFCGSRTPGPDRWFWPALWPAGRNHERAAELPQLQRVAERTDVHPGGGGAALRPLLPAAPRQHLPGVQAADWIRREGRSCTRPDRNQALWVTADDLQPAASCWLKTKWDYF